MKVIHAIIAMLLSLILCQAQNSNAPKRAPDEAYTKEMTRLLTGLQANPWQGWKAGTTVVFRYFGASNPAANPLDYVQPDMVYQILEADKLFIRTQAVNGKPIRQDFLVKDQQGLDKAGIRSKDVGATDIELDGFMLTGLLSVSRMDVFPGGSRITNEWSLASHPSILLRKEVNGVGWRVMSAKVLKKIGEREFSCVEIKKWTSIYMDGRIDVITTQYLSPDMPGHLVEETQEFSRVGKKQERSPPHMVIHQKVVEVRLQ